MKYFKFYLLTIGIIILDQVVKLVVYYNMDLGNEFPVFGEWFKIHYTVNPGMAFGLELGSEFGKFALTTFRLIAMVGIGYYLFTLIKKQVPQGLSWCIALILGGAVGNVIDSTFYGVLLPGNAPDNVRTPWFHGQVIDMFYIDIWEGRVAEWVPLFGGDYMSLWPIFNIADASIFVGVAIILIFQKKFFVENNAQEEMANESIAPSEIEAEQR
ncbi:MAG: lipoprotein signal peptidase [Cyclobacteriaceae bacterium]|nr:lipoprotein signal peptidase [Cyclobacteriaceae bacterium]